MYKQKRPIELSEFVKEIYKRPGAHDLFRKSDRIHESEREYWNTESSKQNDHKLTGHTPKERLSVESVSRMWDYMKTVLERL